MDKVVLVKRWGAHDAGDTVEVDDAMRKWLVGLNYAENREGDASAGAFAPGTHGADPRAGGDLSRPGTPRWSRGPRVKNVTEDNPEGEHVNRGVRVQGAPKAAGDVSHVAPENLGSEHKTGSSDARTASGEQAGAAAKESTKGAGENSAKDQGKDEKNPRFSW